MPDDDPTRQKPARARRRGPRTDSRPEALSDDHAAAEAGEEALAAKRAARRRERARLVAYDVGGRVLAGERRPRPEGTVLRLDLDDAERLGLVERSAADEKLLGPSVAPSSSTPPSLSVPTRVDPTSRRGIDVVEASTLAAAHDWDARLWKTGSPT